MAWLESCPYEAEFHMLYTRVPGGCLSGADLILIVGPVRHDLRRRHRLPCGKRRPHPPAEAVNSKAAPHTRSRKHVRFGEILTADAQRT
jgi:hypothetical protein